MGSRCFLLVVWFAFLGFWVARSVAPMRFFAIPHAAVGVWVAYGVLWQLFNTTRVTLAPDGLRVQTRPFPRSRDHRVSLDRIDGFGVHNARGVDGQDGPKTDWQVRLLLSDRTSRPLRLGLAGSDHAHARYVADVLNARLALMREGPRGYRG